MPRPPLFRAAFLLILALLIVPPLAHAAGSAVTSFPSAWDLLLRAWSLLESAWGDNGCQIDPDGRCVAPPQASLDNGCQIDPSGACQASSALRDNGCQLDPNGRCVAPSQASSLDNGCQIDPNGACRN